MSEFDVDTVARSLELGYVHLCMSELWRMMYNSPMFISGDTWKAGSMTPSKVMTFQEYMDRNLIAQQALDKPTWVYKWLEREYEREKRVSMTLSVSQKGNNEASS